MSALNDAFEKLDAFVTKKMHLASTPGAVLALTDRETTLYIKAYGVADLETRTPVTPGHLFEIGSIGKSFTAIMLLQAREEGLIDLHAPVTDYLPWFEVRTQYAPITLHHLLTHSAGLVGGSDLSPDPRGCVWNLRHTETAYAPGEHFHYSNDGYKLLGLVLQTVRGKPYAEIVQERIFDPLGMADSFGAITNDLYPRMAKGYRPLHDDRLFYQGQPLIPAAWFETDSGDGSIAATAADMAVYARIFLNGGRGPRGRILSEESFALMTTPYLSDEEDEEEGGAWDYGYGLSLFEEDGFRYIGHSGGMVGYTAYMHVDVDNGLGVALLMTQPGMEKTDFLALKLLRAAHLGQPLPEMAVPDPHRVENAADFAGTYRAGEKTLTLIAEGDRLWLHHAGGRILLEAAPAKAFIIPHPNFDRYLLTFGREGEGDEGPVVEAFHGLDWYVNERYTGPTTFDTPPKWAGYAGHYRSHNPWMTDLRVALRKGQLVATGIEFGGAPLTPLPDGSFRAGEKPHSPERLRFEQIVDGQAWAIDWSGAKYYRFFTP
jgi:D-alanyl-D-alanine carboxypeptidase